MPALWEEIRRHSLERTADALARRERLRGMGETAAGEDLLRFHLASEQGVLASLSAFAEVPPAVRQSAAAWLAGLGQMVGEGSASSASQKAPKRSSTAVPPRPRVR